MCIIIAKPQKVAMPSEEILRTCFTNNPDGAGFMLAAKGQVYGFKGLMTFEELTSELAKAERRFGRLDKLAVVIHCRIATHGSTVAGNTHPFPLCCGYREMRKTEWVAKQGFAHNGIIEQTAFDKDVKKFNVSDTMVFAKKYVSPIARHAEIAADHDLLDMLFSLADSKLCFLSGKGRLATRGDFTENDGVLYSNTSFREARKHIKYDYTAFSGWSYEDDSSIFCHISRSELAELKSEIEYELGLEPLPEGTRIRFTEEIGGGVDAYDDAAMDCFGNLYYFSESALDYQLLALPEEYDEIILPEEEEDI